MIYRYIKTINNNAIVASDKNKHEVVIMGKAIGVKCNRILGARIDNELTSYKTSRTRLKYQI